MVTAHAVCCSIANVLVVQAGPRGRELVDVLFKQILRVLVVVSIVQ